MMDKVHMPYQAVICKHTRRCKYRNVTVKAVIICLIVILIAYIITSRLVSNKRLNTPEIPSSASLGAHGDSGVRIFQYHSTRNETETETDVVYSRCVTLHSFFFDILLYVHDPKIDTVISASITEFGTWEPNILYVCGSILRNNEHLEFLDLGCNIGIYSLYAAKFGRKVVSVDPVKKNLILLSRSLEKGKLRNNVTLLWNAVSNRHERVTMETVDGNIGGTYIKASEKRGGAEQNVFETITLNDLVPYFNQSSVFIKMDIERYELKALQGAKQFFNSVDVAYILMEWVAHKNAKSGKMIIDLLTSYGLYPHINAHFDSVLDLDMYHHWPDDVFWIRL